MAIGEGKLILVSLNKGKVVGWLPLFATIETRSVVGRLIRTFAGEMPVSAAAS